MMAILTLHWRYYEKNLFLVLSVFCVFALVFSACDSSSGSSDLGSPDPGNGFAGNGFTVSFNSHGGSAVSSQEVPEGGRASTPADPSRSGHRFEGWYTDNTFTTPFNFSGTPITADITLHGRWMAVNTFRVTFNPHNGESLERVYVPEGLTVARPPDPTNPDSTLAFRNWYTSQTGGVVFSFTSPVTSNRTAHAQWTAQDMGQVIFRGGAVGVVPPNYTIQVPLGSIIPAARIPTLTRPGFAFQGWVVAAGSTTPFTIPTTPIATDTDIYASWLPLITHIVTFRLSSSSDSSHTIEVPVLHGDFVIPPSQPTPASLSSAGISITPPNTRTFNGWFTTSTGGAIFNTGVPITASTTVFARWNNQTGIW